MEQNCETFECNGEIVTFHFSDETIPFIAIRCDSIDFTENDAKVYIDRTPYEGDRHLVMTIHDYDFWVCGWMVDHNYFRQE